jgi:regulator of sigma E protease
LAHPALLDAGWKLGFVTIPPTYRDNPLPLKKASAKATQFCAEGSGLLLQMLERVAERRVAASHVLAGPVGIARIAGEAAETKDWYSKFNLAGQISISLGVFNLLPFPILDGGMILFLLIESVLRREVNIVLKERIYQAAFVVLMFFAVFVIFNDVSKLPIFTHLKP